MELPHWFNQGKSSLSPLSAKPAPAVVGLLVSFSTSASQMCPCSAHRGRTSVLEQGRKSDDVVWLSWMLRSCQMYGARGTFVGLNWGCRMWKGRNDSQFSNWASRLFSFLAGHDALHLPAQCLDDDDDGLKSRNQGCGSSQGDVQSCISENGQGKGQPEVMGVHFLPPTRCGQTPSCHFHKGSTCPLLILHYLNHPPPKFPARSQYYKLYELLLL